MALITYVAEDNPTILHNLIESLHELAAVQVNGFGATEAEAIEWLRRQGPRWHLAILDLFLREGSGLGILASCQSRMAHQKMVVLTNYATPEIRRRSVELGADAVFDKSSELDGLFAYCMARTADYEAARLVSAESLHVRGRPMGAFTSETTAQLPGSHDG